MEGIARDWQSVDGAMVKASLAIECVGANPTDREKKGRKRSLLVDGRGIPLSIVASGANVHDVKLLATKLDQVVRVTGTPCKIGPASLRRLGLQGSTRPASCGETSLSALRQTTPRRSGCEA